MMATLTGGRGALLEGLQERERKEMNTFLGMILPADRDNLQIVAAMLYGPDASMEGENTVERSPKQTRIHRKGLLLEFITCVPVDLCVAALGRMSDMGSNGSVEMMRLFERYCVADKGAKGAETQAQIESRGICPPGVEILRRFLAVEDTDMNYLVGVLAGWGPEAKAEVLSYWEVNGEPRAHVPALLAAIREESSRATTEDPYMWRCMVCKRKQESTVEFLWTQGMYGTKEAAQCVADVYKSPLEPLFELKPYYEEESIYTQAGAVGRVVSAPYLVYAGVPFDLRRLCATCFPEARAFVMALGNSMEVHHAVDQARRDLLAVRSHVDALKADWLKRECRAREEGGLLQRVCHAIMDASATAILHERKVRATPYAAMKKAEEQREMDVRSVAAAAYSDPAILKQAVSCSTASSKRTHLLAGLALESTLGLEGTGGVPAPAIRRTPLSALPADTLPDGTPITRSGVKHVLQVPGAIEDRRRADENEREQLTAFHKEAVLVAGLLSTRQLIRRRQRSEALCLVADEMKIRWMATAAAMDDKRRLRGCLSEMERERARQQRADEKTAQLKLREKLREEARRRDALAAERSAERARISAVRRRMESTERSRMTSAEAEQRMHGDAFWGLINECDRLRALIDARQRKWEVDIRDKRGKMLVIGGGTVAEGEWMPEGGVIPPPEPLLQGVLAVLEKR